MKNNRLPAMFIPPSSLEAASAPKRPSLTSTASLPVRRAVAVMMLDYRRIFGIISNPRPPCTSNPLPIEEWTVFEPVARHSVVLRNHLVNVLQWRPHQASVRQ